MVPVIFDVGPLKEMLKKFAGISLMSLLSLIAIYIGLFIWFRSYSFYWTDLDGNEHHSTIDHFRESSSRNNSIRESASKVFFPLIKLDKIIFNRDFDDEM